MKCPECGVEQKKREKRRCRCGYRFILHAASVQDMTDVAFLKILQLASQGGRFYFTFPQLYTAWCQQDAAQRLSLFRKRLIAVCVFQLVLFIAFFLFYGWAVSLLALAFLFIPWLLVRQHRRQSPPDVEQLKKSVRQWQAGCGGGDEMLLLKPDLHELPADFPERKFIHYGVERIIIVERRLLVDLLVRNGFHADQKALIFSRDGYPSSILHCAQEILRKNRSLPVYLLHDSSEAGMLMQRKLKLSGREIIDLGMRPDHVKKMKFLEPLQLEKKGYKAPLDILPYPVLATLCGQALREESSLFDVLEKWDEARSTGFSFMMRKKQKNTGRQEG